MTGAPGPVDLSDRKAPLSKRLLAYVIDIVPAMIAVFALGFTVGLSQDVLAYMSDSSEIDRREFIEARNTLRDLSFLVYVLYAAAMEASPLGRTIGKLIVGIRPWKKSGEPLTLGRAVGRNLAKIISLIPLGAGFWWAIFRSDNRGWHDLIAGTYVAERDPSTPPPS